MLEILTGTGLAAAAGLNAYIPLLIMGIAGRIDWIQLPNGWLWLENEWVMVILGVLLVIEIVADKVPAVDSVNDWIQTVVRPASGGIVFAGGIGTSTVAVDDPGTFFSSGAWIPVVIGIVLALLMSLAKSAVRPVANLATGGAAAPALSTAEDGASIVLVILAIVAPILVLIALGLMLFAFVTLIRRVRRKRRERAAQATQLA
jgi:large-conductance mechanosensitive channel